MKWAFVDYENIGSLSEIDISSYEKIIVFLGARQPRLDFGDKKYESPVELTLIQLKATQANNLDFHLSYYLGKYDNLASSDVAFEIISNDNGFSPLIAHIKANGRPCRQVKLASASSATDAFIQSLSKQPVNKRPQKLTGLRNHIASQLGIQGNQVAIQSQLNQLVSKGYLKVSGDTIEYKC